LRAERFGCQALVGAIPRLVVVRGSKGVADSEAMPANKNGAISRWRRFESREG
jgi:hypothetical protein